jgi:broad specificity phosphatase PhoE
MHLYLIRHGQSANNAAQEGAPHIPDCPLTDLGHKQARRVAQRMTGENITHLFCSPMLRTLQTMQPIAEALGLSPQVWVSTHEKGGAVWERDRANHDFVNTSGLTRREMQARFPGYTLPDAVGDDGWWRYDKGLEPFGGVIVRGQQVAAELFAFAKANPEANAALVSHGGFLDALIRGIFEMHGRETIFFLHNNTGVSKINVWEWRARTVMIYHNRIDHLPPELIS